MSNISTKGLILFAGDEADGRAYEDVFYPLGPIDLTLEIAVIFWFEISASIPFVVVVDQFIEIVGGKLGHFLNSDIR